MFHIPQPSHCWCIWLIHERPHQNICGSKLSPWPTLNLLARRPQERHNSTCLGSDLPEHLALHVHCHPMLPILMILLLDICLSLSSAFATSCRSSLRSSRRRDAQGPATKIPLQPPPNHHHGSLGRSGSSRYAHIRMSFGQVPSNDLKTQGSVAKSKPQPSIQQVLLLHCLVFRRTKKLREQQSLSHIRNKSNLILQYGWHTATSERTDEQTNKQNKHEQP